MILESVRESVRTSVFVPVIGGSDNSFSFEVKTTTPGETFTLPLESGGDYDFKYKTDDGQEEQITAYDQAEVTRIFADAGTHNVVITGTITGLKFNNHADAALVYEISSFGCLRFLPSSGYAFHGCSNMTMVGAAIGGPTTTGVKIFSGFYRGCASFVNVDLTNMDVSSATHFYVMFMGCNSMTYLNITNWDSSNVLNMLNMFYQSLLFNQDLGWLPMSSVTGATSMFWSTGMSTENWSDTIIGFAAQAPDLQTGVTISCGAKHNAAGSVAIAYLVDNYSWTVNDSGLE